MQDRFRCVILLLSLLCSIIVGYFMNFIFWDFGRRPRSFNEFRLCLNPGSINFIPSFVFTVNLTCDNFLHHCAFQPVYNPSINQHATLSIWFIWTQNDHFFFNAKCFTVGNTLLLIDCSPSDFVISVFDQFNILAIRNLLHEWIVWQLKFNSHLSQFEYIQANMSLFFLSFRFAPWL